MEDPPVKGRHPGLSGPAWLTRSVRFRFRGKDLNLGLSTELFSSADIDMGSRLLLKLIARNVPPESRRKVLDIGCGVGVLGLALAADNPESRVLLQDRDALAVACTAYNARANKVRNVELDVGLGLTHVVRRRFDLVVSNFPAKAGVQVLESLVSRIGWVLEEGGVAALVVVAPLAEILRGAVAAAGGEVVAEEVSKGHTALVFRPGPATAVPGFVGYERGEAKSRGPRGPIRIPVFLGLPEFDTLSYASRLLMASLKLPPIQDPSGRNDVLVINPGQGHIAVAALQAPGGAQSPIDLVSRDVLQVVAASRAVVASRPDRPPRRAAALEDGGALVARLTAEGRRHRVVASLPEGAIPVLMDWATAAAEAAGSRLHLVGRSADIVRVEKSVCEIMGTSPRFDSRNRGFRVIVLDRKILPPR